MTTQLILAAISADSLIHVVIWIIVAGVIWWLLNWLINYAGIPEPFNKVAKVILAIVVVLILINALLTLVGRPLVTW